MVKYIWCHNSIPCPNSSIVFVASVRTSTKALNDARRNLASTASKCLYKKDKEMGSYIRQSESLFIYKSDRLWIRD